MADKIPKQIKHMSELVELSDIDCFDNLRMNCNTFNRLCYLLRHSGGLVDGRYVTMGEQVALFLSVLSHHSKVRLGCLGALDGTLIDVTIPEIDKARYRTRKGTVAVNEGSAVDAHVLRDTLTRDDGFRVPQGLMEGVTTDQVLEKLRNMNDKGHRGWSIREEQSDYLNLLGTYMKQVLPNTDLKLEPHINSRITVWKKNYHSLFEILKNTGVGLDLTTKMVEATEEQWVAFMKYWPLYEDWSEIFGQSRATSEGAESHANADTPPPSYNAAFEADYGFDKVVDENQAESQSHSGYAVTGESSDMAKTSSGRK
ncbi:hypothetical protein ACS0TY_035610 [Phlomoides rotata]